MKYLAMLWMMAVGQLVANPIPEKFQYEDKRYGEGVHQSGFDAVNDNDAAGKVLSYLEKDDEAYVFRISETGVHGGVGPIPKNRWA